MEERSEDDAGLASRYPPLLSVGWSWVTIAAYSQAWER